MIRRARWWFLLLLVSSARALAQDAPDSSGTEEKRPELDGKTETELQQYIEDATKKIDFLEGVESQLEKELAEDETVVTISARELEAKTSALSEVQKETAAVTAKLEEHAAETERYKALSKERDDIKKREGEAKQAHATAQQTHRDSLRDVEVRKAVVKSYSDTLKRETAWRDTVKARLEKQRLRTTKLATELSESRYVRCQVALCWGEGGSEWAVEPVLDLPIGIVWSAGSGALTSYINANKLNIEFNAGLRIWMWHDRFSIMLYFAAPVARGDDKVRLEGSDFEHPTSSIQRPFPSLGIGFLGDILQIGFAYDVLINGDGEQDRDPRYRPNQVLSRSLTITLGFATVLTARTALAHANSDKEDAK